MMLFRCSEVPLYRLFSLLIYLFGTYTVAVIIYCMGQSLILTLCFIPVIIAVMPLVSLISRPLKEITDRQRESAAESLKKVQETLRAPEFVKAYGLEEKMDSRMDQALAERRRQEEASAVLVGLIDGLIYFASYLPGLIAVGAGAIFMLRGELTAGFLVGFVQTAVQRFGGLVPQLGGIVTGTRQASASAELLMEILDAPVPEAGKEGNPEDEQVIRKDKESFLCLSRWRKGPEGSVAYRKARGVCGAGGRERLWKKYVAEASDGRLSGV